MTDPSFSALSAALERIGDRWSLLVIEALMDGPRRFNDLLEAVPGIAPNILSQRLKRLERDALVVARPYSKKPPRSAYELTAPGSELAGALRQLTQWGARREGTEEPSRHATCGTPLEARWYCPTCARAVDEDEPTELRIL